MLTIALFLTLAAHPDPAVDTVEVYSAILREVRTEYPGRPIALAESRWGADLEAARAERDHSPEILAGLRARALIDTTCAPSRFVTGCAGLEDHVLIVLGRIGAEGGPPRVEGAVWVEVAFLLPGTRKCPPPGSEEETCFPNAFGFFYLLRPQADGTRIIERKAPGFAI